MRTFAPFTFLGRRQIVEGNSENVINVQKLGIFASIQQNVCYPKPKNRNCRHFSWVNIFLKVNILNWTTALGTMLKVRNFSYVHKRMNLQNGLRAKRLSLVLKKFLLFALNYLAINSSKTTFSISFLQMSIKI